jgi:hypothetical protein
MTRAKKRRRGGVAFDPTFIQGIRVMRNPQRTVAEIHLLSTHFGEVSYDENDPSAVLILHFLLPEGYNRSECEVVIDLGPRYPELPPQDFYLSRGLTKNSHISSHYFRDFKGKKYCHEGFAWYSFHIKKWQPNPQGMLGGDNLLSAVNAFYNALKTD